MKLNEEIDAIVTLGLSPFHVLVIPRIAALVIAMPLLVFIGDLVGILGGSFIAWSDLGITMSTFIERMHTVLPVHSFFSGLIKAPFFAAFIGLIGCRMGLAVEGSARSVGLHTTATVVQSIVAVILLNAAFAVIFVKLHI
jgi:phospholipid/cholesterol/gamma-HCH transport system permease protein